METIPIANLLDKLFSLLKCRALDPRSVHGLSLKLGCLSSAFLCNNLLHSYASQSLVVDARKLFDETPHRNAVTASLMISGYTQVGNLQEAILLLTKMLHDKVQESDDEDGRFPSKYTFGSIITCCARIRDLRTGIQTHCSVIKFGAESDAFIAGVLIDMYAKCGEVGESCRIFHQTSNRNVVTWTTMITCLVNSGQYRSWVAAFGHFRDMICRGIRPVAMTFASLVKIFDEPDKLSQAKQVHGCMVKLGIEVDDHMRSSLIATYGRCRGMDEVVRLSARMNRDVVSWTSLLVAYTQNEYNREAINAFRMMVEKKLMVDPFVIAGVIGACSALGELRTGKEIHGYALRNSFMTDVSVGNAVIMLYGRCGEIGMAERVFQLMKGKDVVSWTALLTCYSQDGYGGKAISLFRQMLQIGLSPPLFSVTGAIRACSMTASFSIGQQIHSRTVKIGIDDYLSVKNSLITMYAKCGNIEVASRIFHSMSERDNVSWNALITGFSQHGHEKKALELFDQMHEEGMRPDDYTFTGLLVSCSRAGLIAEGCKFFKLMTIEYGLEPKMEHYACMVDLFGRAGMLQDAMDFVNSIPCKPDQLVWETLLASCKVHGNVELGKFAAENILQMRSEDPSPYITLSSIHASMGMWDRKACIRAAMKAQGVRKDAARSWIEAQEWSEE